MDAAVERGAALAHRRIHRELAYQRLRRFLRRRLAIVGAILVFLQLALALFAPLLATYDPVRPDFLSVLQPPSRAHLLGTDDLGRDIFSRLIYGARISLAVGVIAVVLAVLVSVPLGLITGYFGGPIDEGVMRVMDSLMALPPLVLALTIAAVLGPGIKNVVIAIAVVSVPTYSRLMRGQVLSVKQNDYIWAARAVGLPVQYILFRHIMPNAISPIIVQASLGVGFAIITESALSFIGLGAQPPTPTWGSMVQVGFQYLEIAPWFVLAPATMIFIAVLGFNLLGDGLREALDPSIG